MVHRGRKPGDRFRGSLKCLVISLLFIAVLPMAVSACEEVIKGCKYNDLNGNGVRDPGEPGIPGVTIVLKQGSTTYTEKTGCNGCYEFSKHLFAGSTWTLSERVPSGWVQTSPPGGSYAIKVRYSGEKFSGKDFGNTRETATIIGRKFEDLNWNGAWDAGEPFLNGWTIELRDDAGNKIATDVTGTETVGGITGDGYFCFGGCTAQGFTGGKDMILAAGTYTVSEIGEPGWVSSSPDDISVTLTCKQIWDNLLFGNTRTTGSICGNKILRNTGEFLDGWTIRLSRGSIPVGEVITGQDGEKGHYCFTGLAPGVYTVSEDLQDGFIALDPAGGTTQVTLGAGENLVVPFTNIGQGTTTVPEFPTVGVPAAVLLGLGFVVLSLRKRDP